jgi:hypothetical protein
MSPVRRKYYTLMMESELIDALKEAKAVTGLSEGALIRLALRAELKRQGIAVAKPPAPKAHRPARPSSRTRRR